MLKGKTSTGFEFELDEEVMDDYELLELLHKIDEGSTNLITEMVDKLLGESQKNKLKDHVRSEKGRVSAKQLLEEVKEIFESNNTGKN